MVRPQVAMHHNCHLFYSFSKCSTHSEFQLICISTIIMFFKNTTTNTWTENNAQIL